MTSKPNVLPPVTLLFIAVTLAFSMPALASDPDQRDLKKAAQAKGCDLIPYEELRKKCMEANQDLHTPNTCDAMACQESASRAANQQRLNAFTLCVTKREASNNAFSRTVKMLIDIKENKKKKYSNEYTSYLNTILTKIKAGTRNHVQALDNAKTVLQKCKSVNNVNNI